MYLFKNLISDKTTTISCYIITIQFEIPLQIFTIILEFSKHQYKKFPIILSIGSIILRICNVVAHDVASEFSNNRLCVPLKILKKISALKLLAGISVGGWGCAGIVKSMIAVSHSRIRETDRAKD